MTMYYKQSCKDLKNDQKNETWKGLRKASSLWFFISQNFYQQSLRNKKVLQFLFQIFILFNPFQFGVPLLQPLKLSGKPLSILMFSGGIAMQHWAETGLILFSIFSVQVAVQFSSRNYEDLLPATETEHVRVSFTEFLKILRTIIFQYDFEGLLLKLNSRVNNRRGEDFDRCRFSHFSQSNHSWIM